MARREAMIFRLGAVALAAALALSGCQTLSEDQCNVTDWRTLGTSDGLAGRAQSHVARHQEACNKYGVTVDVLSWQSGWEQGIRQHCTPKNGLETGLRGKGASSACPADLAFPYREAYRVGNEAYWARQEVDRIQDELDDSIDALAQATPENRESRRLVVEVKRNELFSAEARARRAERAADRYRFGLLTVN